MMFGLIELFLFLCVVYYVFGKRTGDMVDIISTRFQNVYDSWNQYNNNNNNNNANNRRAAVILRPERNTNRSAGHTSKHQERALRQEQDVMDYQGEVKVREQSLYQLKQTKAPETAPPYQMSSLSLSCRYCRPDASEIQLTPRDRRRSVIDVLQTRPQLMDNGYGRTSYLSPAFWFPNVTQSLRNHRYDFPEVSAQVLADERLKSAIDQAAVESVRERREMLNRDSFDEEKAYEQMLKKHKTRAQKVLVDMRAMFSNAVLAFTSWLVYTCLPMFLSGAILHPGQLEMIKNAIKKSPNTPLIFLPLHRSHIDYILVTFMSLNNNIQCPVVVAGDNLKIPVVGAMLRGLGAFFIKRKIDPVVGKKDVVYRAVLHSYLQNCLSAGHNIEFFMEGGRTRTGKPCMPKGGVLSVIIDAFVEGTIDDALLVPVSMNYEKLVDGNFVNEQLGQRKKKETLFTALRVFWKSINSHYGTMRIDFNEPFSLKEIVNSSRRMLDQDHHRELEPIRAPPHSERILQQTKSSTSLFGTDIVEEELRSIVDNVARHVVFDCATATTVMSSNAVIFLLLHRFRNGVSLERLAKAMDNLRDDLIGIKDVGFTGNSNDVIKYVVDLMGKHLISAEQVGEHLIIKPVHTIEAMLELSYYANTLMPHYALKSVIATSIFTILDRTCASIEMDPRSLMVDREELLSLALEYCDILRYEFILHKPCQDLTQLLYESIDMFALKEFINLPKSCRTEEERKASEIAHRLEASGIFGNDDFDSPVPISDPISINTSAIDELKIYVGFLAPITNTYLTVVECLNGLLGNNCLVESEFFKICIKELKENYRSGLNSYGESVSLEMVKSCAKLLEKWAVTKVESDAGVRLLVLTEGYRSSSAIEMVYDRMQKFVPTLELPYDNAVMEEAA